MEEAAAAEAEAENGNLLYIAVFSEQQLGSRYGCENAKFPKGI